MRTKIKWNIIVTYKNNDIEERKRICTKIVQEMINKELS